MKKKSFLFLLPLLALIILAAAPAIASAEGVTTYPQLVELLHAGGDIVLGGNIEISAALKVDRTVTITGASLTRAGGYHGTMIAVASGGDLTLRDITLDGKNDTSATAPLVTVSGGKLTMDRASVLKDNADYGALTATAGAAVTITDQALISGNKNAHNGGGGISAYNATLIIEGYAKIKGNSSTVDLRLNCGGGIYANATTTIVQGQAVISDNASVLEGGGICSNGGSLNISGGVEIKNNTVIATTRTGVTNVGAGAGVNLDNKTVCVMDGSVRISDNTSPYNGGGIDVEDSQLTLTGDVVISGNTAKQGAGVLFYSGGFGGISGNVEISENIASEDGGGIYNIGDNVTISGNVLIQKNEAKRGGGLYSTKETILEGNTKILSNKAGSTGGGLHVYGTNLTIRGNTRIADNVAATNDGKGGGMMVNRCNLQISEYAEIASNSALNGGGIGLISSQATISGHTSIYGNWYEGIRFLSGSSSLRLQGNATITNNTTGIAGYSGTISVQDEVSIQGNSLIHIDQSEAPAAFLSISGPLYGGASIGVLGKNNILVNNSGKSYQITDSDMRHIFTNTSVSSESQMPRIKLENNQIIQDGSTNNHLVEILLPDGNGWKYIDEDDYWYGSLTNAFSKYVNGSNRKSGEIRFKISIRRPLTENGTFKVPDGAIVELSGAALKQGADSKPLFQVEMGGMLKLSGITISGNGSQSNSEPLIVVQPGGTLILDSGAVIKGCASTGNGAAIFNSGTLTIQGSAVIKDCESKGNGGAIFSDYSGATITMTGGTIVGNKAQNGGAIYAKLHVSNAFTMESGTIRNNTATGAGGGLHIQNEKWKIEGGTVANNKASEGGVIYTYNAPLTLSAGAVISGNTAANGGGLFQMGDTHKADASIQGTISDNTASESGGGIFTKWDTLKLPDDAKIVRNTATKNGGAIYVDSTQNVPEDLITLNALRASINGNFAADGGGIYIAHGKVLLGGTKVTNNQATGSGGGVYKANTSDVQLLLSGITEVFDNTGGNLFLFDNDKFDLPFFLANAKIGVTTTRAAIPSVIGVPASSITLSDAVATYFSVDNNPDLKAKILENKVVLGELPTYAFNTPDPVTQNGLTLSVTYTPSVPQNAGAFVTATYTLSGTALASGTQTIGFTGSSIKDSTTQNISVAALQRGETISFTKTYTFEIPDHAMTDLALVNTFKGFSVTSVGVDTQPKRQYVEGDPLDLSAMKLLVTYSNGSTATLSYNSSGVSVSVTGAGSIENGAILSTAMHNGKTLTVTYQDITAQTQALQVLSTDKAITKFEILGQSATIDDANAAITLALPYGTDLSSLTPTITHTGASISPASGAAQNFTSPAAYTVTAADGTTKGYTVTVTVPPQLTMTISPRAFFCRGESGGDFVLTVGHGTTLAPQHISAVTVDGVPLVNYADYKKTASGSVDITLLEAYLNRLPVGAHEIKVHVTSGPFAVQTPSLMLTVNAPVPKTGDNDLSYLSMALLALAAAGLLLVVWYKKRTEQSH